MDVAKPSGALVKGLSIRSDRFGIEPEPTARFALALVNHLGEAGRRRRGPGPRP